MRVSSSILLGSGYDDRSSLSLRPIIESMLCIDFLSQPWNLIDNEEVKKNLGMLPEKCPAQNILICEATATKVGEEAVASAGESDRKRTPAS